MNKDQLNVLRILAQKATQGPWAVYTEAKSDGFTSFYGIDGKDKTVVLWDTDGGIKKKRNANYIAAVDPSTVLQLLDIVDQHDASIEELKSLHQQLDEKAAEIERLKQSHLEQMSIVETRLEKNNEQLAASQAREVQQSADFCEAIKHAISLGLDAHVFLEYWNEGDWDGCKEYGFEPSAALKEPWSAIQETAALEAMLAKAGELATDRALKVIENYQIPVGNSAAGEMAYEWTYEALKEVRDEIQAFSAITIEDLQK